MYPVFFCKYVSTTKSSRYKILTKRVRKAIFLSGFSYKNKTKQNYVTILHM